MTRAALALLALAACSEPLPKNALPPTEAEWVQLDIVRARWEERLGPLSQRCVEFYARTRIIDADRFDKLRHCWRDEPGQCEADASMSRWGCCAGCIIVRDRTPIPVISVKIQGFARDYLIRHEAVHALGHCERRYEHLGHRDPVLWGPDGVHPL
jgi:hypothetical protein